MKEEVNTFSVTLPTTMNRYFFHLVDHSEFDVDVDGRGQELPDVAAAIAVATDEMRKFLADQVRNGYLDLGLKIDIADENGRKVATVCRSDAVKLR